jgi:hypothetical protein
MFLLILLIWLPRLNDYFSLREIYSYLLHECIRSLLIFLYQVSVIVIVIGVGINGYFKLDNDQLFYRNQNQNRILIVKTEMLW